MSTCACGQPCRPRKSYRGPTPSSCADCRRRKKVECQRRRRNILPLGSANICACGNTCAPRLNKFGHAPTLCPSCRSAKRLERIRRHYAANKASIRAVKRVYEAGAGKLRRHARAEARERGVPVEMILQEWRA